MSREFSLGTIFPSVLIKENSLNIPFCASYFKSQTTHKPRQVSGCISSVFFLFVFHSRYLRENVKVFFLRVPLWVPRSTWFNVLRLGKSHWRHLRLLPPVSSAAGVSCLFLVRIYFVRHLSPLLTVTKCSLYLN